jgi:glycerophosphoryl diester phosphodiesterase
LKNPRYKFIEFDVQYSKDKKKVIFHDFHLRRVELKFKNLEDLTYEEIENEVSFHVPVYEEVMDLVAGKKPLNIEVKTQGDTLEDQELTDFIINDITERGITDQVLFTSVTSDVIEYSKVKYPHVKTGKIYWVIPATFIENDLLIEQIFQEVDRVNADYLLLYAANLKIYDSIKDHLQKREQNGERKVHFAIWYLIGEMFLIHEDAEMTDEEDFSSLNTQEPDPERLKEIGAWWVK